MRARLCCDPQSKMDTDIGVTTGQVTPAQHPAHTAPWKVTRGASREYAVASGLLVDVSLKGALHQ